MPTELPKGQIRPIPEIDYEALIEECFKRTKQRQGTSGCVAFAKGAEWFRELMLAAGAQVPAEPAAQAANKPLLLRGIGKINGDGWKDTTRIGEVVYAWNAEKPAPYVPGQFPRLGNKIWSASRDQYDFEPLPNDDLPKVVDAAIEELRAQVATLKQGRTHASAQR